MSHLLLEPLEHCNASWWLFWPCWMLLTTKQRQNVPANPLDSLFVTSMGVVHQWGWYVSGGGIYHWGGLTLVLIALKPLELH